MISTLTDKVRIGIIGCGEIVKTVHLPVLLNIDGAKAVFLYDLDEKKSKALSENNKLSYIKNEEDIPWDQVDCFLITVPYGIREDLYRKIASRIKDGQFLFVEKPVVLSMKDLNMFKNLNLYNRMFSGFMRRHYSNTNLLKGGIEGFGPARIKTIYISEGGKTMATAFDASNYRVSGALSGGGVLAETSCHALDQVAYLFPDASYEVNDCFIVYDGEMDVHVEGKLDLVKDGLRIPVISRFSRLENLPSQISIEFGDFTLTSGLTPRDEPSLNFTDSRYSYRLSHDNAFATVSYQAFYLEWLSVISAVKDGKPSVNSLSETFASGIIIESLYNRARQNKTFRQI